MNKHEIGVMGNARPGSARSVAPALPEAFAGMAGGETFAAARSQTAAKVTAGAVRKAGAIPGDRAKKLTAPALPESELYAYGIGQSWIFKFSKRKTAARTRDCRYIQYTVRSCRLNGNTQYYTVEMSDSDCDSVNEAELTASRLHYLINFNLERSVSPGERRALPLPANVVSGWYAEQRAKREAEAERAKGLLGSYKKYSETEKRVKSLEIEQAKEAVLGDRAHAATLEKQLREQREVLRRLRAELGVPEALLSPAPHCAACRDRGVLPNGRLCGCVAEHEREIRAYWRRERGEAEQ